MIIAVSDTKVVIPIISVIAKIITPENPFLMGSPVPNMKDLKIEYGILSA